jgi:hypothetical protein
VTVVEDKVDSSKGEKHQKSTEVGCYTGSLWLPRKIVDGDFVTPTMALVVDHHPSLPFRHIFTK